MQTYTRNLFYKGVDGNPNNPVRCDNHPRMILKWDPEKKESFCPECLATGELTPNSYYIGRKGSK